MKERVMLECLQDGQHYKDLYDLFTIEKCLYVYRDIQDDFEKKRDTEEFKNFNKNEFDKEVNKAASYYINSIKIQRYKNKKETIQEWMNRDRKDQEKIDKAIPPQGVLCKQCSSTSEFTFKDLWYTYEENAKVLFWFECPNCKKRRAVYDDGTEWYYKPPNCPKCDSPLNHKSQALSNVVTTVYSCPNCSYKNEEVDDYNKEDKEWEEKKARDKSLLVKYREKFCLNDKVGENLLRFYELMSSLAKEHKEKEKKDKDPLFQKARQLKKITFIQLEKLIGEAIEKEGYKDLKFGKPGIGRFVTIDFSVIETKEDRKENNSQNILKKLIKEVLENTNWRLMSEGIQYRLGILTGRLKAYEQEEDLVEIVRKEKD
jgi:Zn finger protein HypA/HybF involved in hydrogenase expression